ncbi:MAG: RidA family protein [Alphaproteobacteria bacterium]|nr:RidA family protein [Alphaproteobacteria bacterium]
MTDSLRHINPPTLTNSLVVGYSQVVAARGQMVFIAGQVGWDATGKMATGFDAEVRQALENVKLALAAAGATTKHVTQVRYFLVGLTRERIETLSKALRDVSMWDWTKPPAGTLVGVEKLARPEFNIEIELMAVIPD